jgi:endoglucanase
MITSRNLSSIARRLMRQPAAPYFEHAVRAEVEAICEENRLRFRRDEFGNVIVRFNAGPASTRPLVLAAHMDHPGFEVVAGKSNGKWNVRFHGGVPDQFFRRGVRLRLLPQGSPATLGPRVGTVKQFQFRTAGPLKIRPRFAVWDLEDFAIRSSRIHGRSCDDLIGVATILAVLIELKRKRAKVNVIGLISRAEEVGLRGALAAIGTKTLPGNALVVSLETSRELPGVKMGQGVILRVGDKTSVFDTKAMRFLAEVCADLQKQDKRFQFQRGLMSGGTCEATAFQEFGFQTGAVCVALGNYHNCGANSRIAAEYIDIDDARTMAELLVAVARGMPTFHRRISKLPMRLEKLRKEARIRLRKTADPPSNYG